MHDFRRIGLTGNGVMVLALLLPLVLFGAACGGPGGQPQEGAGAEGRESTSSAPPEAAGEPAEGDWIISRMAAETENLNPYTSTDAYASRINEFIFESLLDRDNQTLEMIPELAESWEISEDKLTYTFTLHEGTAFSDGTPLRRKISSSVLTPLRTRKSMRRTCATTTKTSPRARSSTRARLGLRAPNPTSGTSS